MENFSEQYVKIKQKLRSWKGASLSLIGPIKIVNFYVLSRLWYRTEFQSIPKELKHYIEKYVLSFV